MERKKILEDFRHFAYEVSRNPMGVNFHCLELLLKEKSDKITAFYKQL